MVRFRQSQLERERIADAHAVFAVEHERDRASDVRIERQRDQVEHVAVVLGRLAFGRRVEIQMRVVLLLQRDIDPALGCDQPRFHFIQRGQVLIHPLAVGLAELLIERTRTLGHGVHQLDAPLQVVALRLQRRAVAAKQAVEHAARVVLRRNRPSFQAVGDRARAREETRSRHRSTAPAKAAGSTAWCAAPPLDRVRPS